MLFFKQIANEKHTFDWGIIVNFKKKSSRNPAQQETTIIVDVLIPVSKNSTTTDPVPCAEGEEGEMEVIPVLHSLISHISSLIIIYPNDLRPAENRKSVSKTINVVKQKYKDGLPLLHPVNDLKIQDPNFKNIISRIEVLEERLYAHPMHKVNTTKKKSKFMYFFFLLIY